LAYSWAANWVWDSENIFDTKIDEDYVLGSDNKYHYDPSGNSGECVGGEDIVPCPSHIQLNFFDKYGFSVAVLIIVLLYFVLERKNIWKKKKKGMK